MPSAADNPGDSPLHGADSPSPEAFQWTCHPARERPLTAIVTAVFLVLLTVGIQLSFRDPVMTVLSAVILSLSVAPFYLPERYSIVQDTVTIQGPFSRKEKDLSRHRRWQADRHGVLLSPFEKPSRLDRFHGLNLRFDARDRDRVIEHVKSRFVRNDGQA